MAHHKSAIKRIKQTAKRTARNKAGRSRVKHAVTAFRTAAANLETTENIDQILSNTASAIDKAASKGFIPAKRASRKISRLAKLLNAQKAKLEAQKAGEK